MKPHRQLATAARHLRRRPALSSPTSPSASSRAAASIPSRRLLHASATARSGAASNPAMAFPCLDAMENRSATLQHATSSSSSPSSSSSGPEPSYTSGVTQVYHCRDPLRLDWGGVLPSFDIAYETWGALNADKSNAILLHTGLSASSHAHSTPENPSPGWWEKFIGPGAPLDTDRFHIICTNVLGGCYGSTGPSSVDPGHGQRYATHFPILTLDDMVRAQFRLLDALGIETLHASVGSSMGGMQSLAAGVLFPRRVARVVCISGCARSHPYSIAMRHTQRQVLMMDPNWNRGFYYGRVPPHAGMKLAREIATVTYRSGPEWEQRFGRRRADPAKPPALCPDFLVETYLDHAGEKWCLNYDPNSLLYAGSSRPPEDLIQGLAPLRDTPALVMGVASDILFPAWQQREVAESLRLAGNRNVTHVELSEEMSLFGHDTFLLDLKHIGGNLKKFLR
ncbi:putative serine-O-acetyltransferase cys2 [Beauveria bassiana]|nr:putative serine-O-acetyltransferase cys2 [Beauveria bassiana]